jgi:hypothetical protein
MESKPWDTWGGLQVSWSLEKPFCFCSLTSLFSHFVNCVHFGGKVIPNSPFTVMVADFLVSVNPTLLCFFTVYSVLFPRLLILYWKKEKDPTSEGVRRCFYVHDSYLATLKQRLFIYQGRFF